MGIRRLLESETKLLNFIALPRSVELLFWVRLVRQFRDLTFWPVTACDVLSDVSGREFDPLAAHHSPLRPKTGAEADPINADVDNAAARACSRLQPVYNRREIKSDSDCAYALARIIGVGGHPK